MCVDRSAPKGISPPSWHLRCENDYHPDFALGKGKTAPFAIFVSLKHRPTLHRLSRLTLKILPLPRSTSRLSRGGTAFRVSAHFPFEPGRSGCSHIAEALDLPAHSTISICSLVIPADQMQQAVREEHRELLRDFGAPRRRLAVRGRDAHDHVAEQASGPFALLSLPLSKGHHVSGAIFPAIDSIESLHLRVVGEQD